MITISEELNAIPDGLYRVFISALSYEGRVLNSCIYDLEFKNHNPVSDDILKTVQAYPTYEVYKYIITGMMKL